MRIKRSSWWKVLGLAGVVGVVATGAVIARQERRRRALTPDEIHARLRTRYTEMAEIPPSTAPAGGPRPWDSH